MQSESKIVFATYLHIMLSQSFQQGLSVDWDSKALLASVCCLLISLGRPPMHGRQPQTAPEKKSVAIMG
jgi:hypothetical protein